MMLQAQGSKTVNCTAGNLSSILSVDERNTITSLAITGTINVRDFITMRDFMPLLAELDLSGVSVVAYNGVGTSHYTNSYPADAIPECAFFRDEQYGKTSLTLVKLPESLTSIGNRAFQKCIGLKTIVFPSSCSSIGADSFRSCSGFTTVSIPSTLTLIGDRAFSGCSGLIDVDNGNSSYSSIDGVLFNKEKTTLIQCTISKTGAFIIPSSVITIGQNAFNECELLTSANLPSTITSIGNNAFSWCTGLITVNLPQSLSYIGRMAFYNCTNLDGTLTIPIGVGSIEFGTFYDCLNLDVVNIPSSVIKIDDISFDKFGGIFNVDEGNPTYSSDDGILFNKTKTFLIQCGTSRQESYKIPSSVTVIGGSAFYRCQYLTGVTIPTSVTTIGASAFRGCRSMLGSIVIPYDVTSIGDNAFADCSGLSSIYSYTTVPVDIFPHSVFYNVNKSSCTLYVPKGSKPAYQSAVDWKEFENIIEMPGFLISSASIKVDPDQGSQASLYMIADIAWTAISDQSWLNVSPDSGNDNTVLIFTAEANPTYNIRSANVTISAQGLKSRTISIVQTFTPQSTITKLYDFDCQLPYSFSNLFSYGTQLVYDGTYLYGIMHNGSDFDMNNKLIRIKPDGSNFEVMYSFDFKGEVFLTLSENVLFGTVNVSTYNSTNNILFKINTNGSNYSKITFPEAQYLASNSSKFFVSNQVIYGSLIDKTTYYNILFKVNTDGSGYSVIYSSYAYLFDNIILLGNTIIGDNHGWIIKVNIDGSGFFDFNISSDIPVIVDNNVIYGIKNAYEGTDGYIFKVNTDGTDFTKIKTLTYSDFGSSSTGALSIVGNTLYGMTEDNAGIFKINTDGSGFAKIQFVPQFGQYLKSPALTLVGSELFGFTSGDGLSSEIFKFNTLNDTFSKVFKFGTSASGMLPKSTLVESDNFLYGNTYSGGSYDMGTLFRINKDGSGFTKLFDFKENETGVRPIGQLTLAGNTLYGTTAGTDRMDYGGIFKINLDGTGFTVLHKFDETNGSPNGSLVLHKGSLYGITSGDRFQINRIIYKINIDGTGFTIMSDNDDIDRGIDPSNGIVISDDDVIYGIEGLNYDAVFLVNTDGTGLRKIFEMNNESGNFSYCKPLLMNDELFITTSEGGVNGFGTIFKIKTDGTGFTVLYNFEGIDDDPNSWGFRNNSLQYYDGTLYGTATGDGMNNHGYLYKINTDGTGFTKLSDFNGEFGSVPYLCDLIIDNNQDIYSMTTFGGKYSGGIIYKYSLDKTSSENYLNNEKTLVRVFPNPVKTGFRINGIKGIATIWLTDINGKLLLSKDVENNEYISARSLPTGVYILRINSKAGMFVKKLVKE
jgi:uncharacterized repeat protein (TIGR03803 family)